MIKMLLIRGLFILIAAWAGPGLGFSLYRYFINREHEVPQLLNSFDPAASAVTLIMGIFIPGVNILLVFTALGSLCYLALPKCPVWFIVVIFIALVALAYLVANSWRS